MTTDYRATVFLPKTAFPMKANLAVREPEILARWAELGLYERLREQAKNREKFILHDGPPYANGHLHMGTALNKILKDVVNRSQQMLGKNAVYVPGWDCHGLPIEWQIEQRYRQAGQDKDAVPAAEFRRECREFAEHWIEVQREEFMRLGVVGDWQHPYTTMEYQAEAGIFRELAKFLQAGELYRGLKSVLWSVVEKTALAEAEVEYHDHTSTTIFVRFPVVKSPLPELDGAVGPDLDDHALDHARQPRGRLRGRGRLPADRGPGGRRGLAGSGRRDAAARDPAGRERDRGGEDHRPPDAGRPARRGARRHGLPPPVAGSGLRLRGAAAGRGLRQRRGRHRPRPHRPLARRRRLRARRRARPRGAGHGRRGRRLHRDGAAVRGPARLQGGRARDRGPGRGGRRCSPAASSPTATRTPGAPKHP